MIQLGQTSMFYNICLSLYFWLVISHNWKERMFKRHRVVAHVSVLVVGCGLAVGAIPFVGPQFGVCGILPPLTTSQWQVSLFYTAPVCITLLVLAGATLAICRSVYLQEKRSQRWLFEQRLKLSRRLFWQSFWYLMAFYMTLPFELLTYYVEFTTPDHFWLLALAAAVSPLQGFTNAFVYFQRQGRKRVWLLICPCLGGDGGETPTTTATKRLKPPMESSAVRPSSGDPPRREAELSLVVLTPHSSAHGKTNGPEEEEGRPVNDEEDFDSESKTATDPSATSDGCLEEESGVSEHFILNEE